ncbi:NAD(P)/FAD-dependent oxidoreductase [Nonomuraea cavernae]|uniref:Pyridine nucleotide-disulfide oxidoreductase n=1 Tax=Nonomuraea cavernae TaxID=2045107 RepID=A0A918DQF9_9ACTN|nr:FAD-dependent oxidoreductase [Nonomuraea cavernae]MCA2189739.1 FAD-dependent oxidoreductase [Nonomuraea cavernae]GGO80007.1 pyridine nucleotide-disulfide oxidoreductase [Nonomuraea cavernae]
MDVVVVGASLAGVRTVQALRRKGLEGRVTLVGSEPHLPYDRPPLSKAFLLGEIDDSSVALLTAEQAKELEVELRLGAPATRVDRAGRAVQLEDGGRLPFDVLIAATGATPRTVPDRHPPPGVHTLRTLDDAVAVRDALAGGPRVAVVGGGFIGAEVACAARTLGLDVTVVDPAPTLMTRGLGPVLGDVMAARHRSMGVSLRTGRSVSRWRGSSRVEALLLDDGSVVAADLVVVGVGASPAVGWLHGSGLDISDGVGCDATLRATGTDDVYAVGDVARWHSTRYGGALRLEHWTSAGEQAMAVAATVTGTPTVFDSLPYVWSDQTGGRLQIFGRVLPGDEVVFVSGGPGEERFAAITGGQGALHAVVAFNALPDAMRYRKLLLQGAEWVAGRGVVQS